MRALRVVGLGDDGKTVICEDPARGERFKLPADERLRAAARGDLTRLGQIDIELESQMRPREIQARIRAGESVDQLAASSGLPVQRVERFAYPVLLERSRIAELAQRAHPVREGGPDVQTLGEVVAHAFGLRGQDYSDVNWDAWKGDDGKWVVQLHWHAGRSDNRAHWAYHPGAHGGTVTALDEHSVDLLDPNPNRPLRTVRPVTELARQALAVEPDMRRQAVAGGEPVRADSVYQEPVRAEPARRESADYADPVRERGYREPAPRQPAYREPEPVRDTVAHPDTDRPVDREPAAPPVPEAVPASAAPPAPASAPAAAVAPPAPTPAPAAPRTPAANVETPPDEAPARPSAPVEPEAEPAPAAEAKPEAKPAAPRRGKSKKNHPVVPSWEDVLLGTRSNRG